MFRTLIRALPLGSAIGLSVVVAAAWIADRHWTLDLIGIALLPAICGLMLVVVSAAFALIFDPKGRRAHGGSLTIGVLALGLGVWLVWPGATPHKTATPLISVWQHNLWVRNPTPERAIAAILAADADVVALIEADSDRFAEPLRLLDGRWPYRVVEKVRAEYRRPSGLRLYSKYPLKDTKVGLGRYGHAWLRATLVLPDGEVHVLLVHLTRPWPFDRPSGQMRQLQEFGAEIGATGRPLMLLGDFNAPSWGRVAREIRETHGLDVNRDGLAGTWPATPSPGREGAIAWPTALSIPIDLTFVSPDLVVDDRQILGGYGSDHRAVTFTVRRTQQEATR